MCFGEVQMKVQHVADPCFFRRSPRYVTILLASCLGLSEDPDIIVLSQNLFLEIYSPLSADFDSDFS